MKIEFELLSWILETIFPNSIVCNFFLGLVYFVKDCTLYFLNYCDYIHPFLCYFFYFLLLIVFIKIIKFIVSIFITLKSDFEFISLLISLLFTILYTSVRFFIRGTLYFTKATVSVSTNVIVKTKRVIHVTFMITQFIYNAELESIFF